MVVVLVDATIMQHARRFIPDDSCDSINCVTHREVARLSLHGCIAIDSVLTINLIKLNFYNPYMQQSLQQMCSLLLSVQLPPVLLDRETPSSLMSTI